MLWTSFAVSTILTILAFLILEPTPRDPSLEVKPLDLIGAFLVTSAGAILVYGFTEAPTGWKQAKVIAPIVIGGMLFVMFFCWEQFLVWKILPRVDPLVPRRIWTYPNLVPLFVETGFLFGCFYMSVLNGATFLLNVQGVSHYSSTHSYNLENMLIQL